MLKLRYWLINSSHYSALTLTAAVSFASLIISLIFAVIYGAVLKAGAFNSVSILLILLLTLLSGISLTVYLLHLRWYDKARWEDLVLTTPVCNQHNIQTIYDVKTDLTGSVHDIRGELATWAWDIPLRYERKLLLVNANIHPAQALTPATRHLTEEDLLIMAALHRDTTLQDLS